MRPLVFISSLAAGGAERVTTSFICRLGKRGLPVAACTVTDQHDSFLAEQLVQSGIRRYDLHASRLASPAALGRYLRLLKRERFDLVHAHGQDASILAALGQIMYKVPLIVTRHVLEEPESNWRQSLRARAALYAIRRADSVVAVSKASANRLAELCHWKAEFVQIIPNGIELERFARTEPDERRDEIRRSLGVCRDDLLVLMLSVLREGKGHNVLLQGWPGVLREMPRARLVIAGAGEKEKEIRAMSEPFENTVRFLGARSDVPELLLACDLVVLPSVSEALPTVLMEAAAAGKAVVATAVGGIPEVVEDGVTGLLVPPGDPTLLTKSILQMLKDPSRRRAFGEAARKVAAQKFSIDVQIEETLALWKQMTEKPVQ